MINILQVVHRMRGVGHGLELTMPGHQNLCLRKVRLLIAANAGNLGFYRSGKIRYNSSVS
jgi:hypothetical protein